MKLAATEEAQEAQLQVLRSKNVKFVRKIK
jgi:hypothetical protein